jgi:hypothetical protein
MELVGKAALFGRFLRTPTACIVNFRNVLILNNFVGCLRPYLVPENLFIRQFVWVNPFALLNEELLSIHS